MTDEDYPNKRIKGDGPVWPEFDANRRGYQLAVGPTHPDSVASALDSATLVRTGQPLEAGPNLKEEPGAPTFRNVDAEVNAKVTAAKDAVKAFVASGALGDGDVTVSISGFANPDNKTIEGHTVDHTTISIGHIAPVSEELQAEIAAWATRAEAVGLTVDASLGEVEAAELAAFRTQGV